MLAQFILCVAIARENEAAAAGDDDDAGGGGDLLGGDDDEDHNACRSADGEAWREGDAFLNALVLAVCLCACRAVVDAPAQ